MKNFIDIYLKLRCTIFQMEIKDFRCLFNSFFWPTDQYLGITYGSKAFITSDQISKRDYVLLLSRLFYNIWYVCFLLFNKLFIKAQKRETIYSNPNKNVNFLIFTWLYKDQISAFISDRKSVYWGEFFLEAEKHVQILVCAVDYQKWNDADIECLIKNGCMIMGLDKSLHLESLVTSVKISLIPFLNLLFKSKDIYMALLFLSSILDKRYLSSLEIYSNLKKKLNGFNLNLITLWEGQPEHRAITAAFKENNLLVFGYIHSSLSINPSFASKIDIGNLGIAFPDRVFIHGSDHMTGLLSIGWSPEDIHIVKSERYVRMNKKEFFEGNLYLPYSVNISKKFLSLWLNISLHLNFTISSIKIHPESKDNPEIRAMLKRVPLEANSKDVFVAGFSTVLFEALESGCENVYQIILDDESGLIDEKIYPSLIQRRIDRNVIKLYLPKENIRGRFIKYHCEDTILNHLNTLIESRVSNHARSEIGIGKRINSNL
ncbi:MAG: hypothetical protein HQK49_22645 [Oligoflexia bacterium]|nr:hypothetical protein [Oligoflexia bacterium]